MTVHQLKGQVNIKQDIDAVRLLVRARVDFQAMRKTMDNRIGIKADGKDQNVEERSFGVTDLLFFQDIASTARKQEDHIEKKLKEVLKRFSLYNNYLVHQKGVGTISSGWIIGEYNIHIASTVSKLWQFTGLNPGMVRGQKRMKKAVYKESMGSIIKEMKTPKGVDCIILTDEMVRGDKLTPGFLAPFNKRLKAAVVEVLASGFIKAKAPYALEFYYPYKARLEQEQNNINGEEKKWSEVSKGRRDRAAKRYMIKMFLKDLYVAWRKIEGLSVREPYAVEFLGKRHAA